MLSPSSPFRRSAMDERLTVVSDRLRGGISDPTLVDGVKHGPGDVFAGRLPVPDIVALTRGLGLGILGVSQQPTDVDLIGDSGVRRAEDLVKTPAKSAANEPGVEELSATIDNCFGGWEMDLCHDGLIIYTELDKGN